MRYTRQAVSHALRSIYSRLDGCRKLQLMQPLFCWFGSFTHSAYLSLSLYLSPARRFSRYFELSVSLSRCVSFFLSATSSVAKPLFAGAHIFHFFLLGWCGLVAWKVCYKTALTSSWRIFLSFRLNAVHRIQLRKIRQPAKRRKTECARENGERMETLLLKIERGKITHTYTQFFLCKRTTT